MATKIEYLVETWNFMGGCLACSPGCKNCWACGLAAGRLKNHPLYKGLTKDGKWTGEIRLCTDIGREDMLEKPLHLREPRTIGVQFMSDLFHEKVPEGFIIDVFDVIAQAAELGHTILILTKRVKRMAEIVGDYCERIIKYPNVHLGVSISTQAEADEKIPIGLQIPGFDWVSVEPMLGPVDLEYIKDFEHPNRFMKYERIYSLSGERNILGHRITSENIDWVVIGAESIGGRPGRECKLEWVRDLVGQCKAANVPVFVKQLHLNGKLVKDINKFPKDLRVREYPKGGG